MTGISVVAVYGGTSIGLQIRDLKRGVQIIVATPGRLIDLIERKAINLEQIQYVVLDEADEMLNMGFQDDIEFILKNTPQRESTWLFSATMPPEIRKVSKRYMKDPVEVTVGKVNTSNKSIDHQYYVTSAQHRYQTLKRIIDFNPGIYGITANMDGCITSDSVEVKKDCYIEMPNTFTPNGDDLNDYFFPKSLLSRGVTAFKMSIFNRWGQLIFETTNPEGRGWDGRWNGVMQPNGVYIYLLDATLKNGKTEHYQGNVTLLR
jgi:gliding motility-associated-like protein